MMTTTPAGQPVRADEQRGLRSRLRPLVSRVWRLINKPRLSWLALAVVAVLSGVLTAAWHDYHDGTTTVRVTCQTLGGTDCTHEITVTATAR